MMMPSVWPVPWRIITIIRVIPWRISVGEPYRKPVTDVSVIAKTISAIRCIAEVKIIHGPPGIMGGSRIAVCIIVICRVILGIINAIFYCSFRVVIAYTPGQKQQQWQ